MTRTPCPGQLKPWFTTAAANASAAAIGLYTFYLSPPLVKFALGLAVMIFSCLAINSFRKKPSVPRALHLLLPSALLLLMLGLSGADSFMQEFSAWMEYKIRQPQFLNDIVRNDAKSDGYIRWDRWNASAFNANAFYFTKALTPGDGGAYDKPPCLGVLKPLEAGFYVCTDYFD